MLIKQVFQQYSHKARILTAANSCFCKQSHTKDEERRYLQLDLEALAIDFGLRRFRLYVVGAPEINTVVTDHKNQGQTDF